MKSKLLISITIVLILIFNIMYITTEQLAATGFGEKYLDIPIDKGAVCVQEGVDFKPGTYEVQKNSVDDISGNDRNEKMVAYITYKMIDENGTGYGNRTNPSGNSKYDYAYNARQEAIWAILNEDLEMGEVIPGKTTYPRIVNTNLKKYQGGGTGETGYAYSSAPGFVKLYSDAEKYATTSNGTASVLTSSGNLVSSSESTTKIAGPYRITFGENGELKNVILGKSAISEGISVSQESEDKVWICDQTGAVKQIKSDEDFYIAIDTTKVDMSFASENKVTLNYIWYEYNLTLAQTLKKKEGATGEDQRIAYFEAEKEEKNQTVTLNLPKLIPPIEVKFKKTDENGNPLSGIEFVLYVKDIGLVGVNGDYEEFGKAFSGDDGWVVFKPYYPLTTNNQCIYLVEKFPIGYDLLKYGRFGVEM